MRALATTLAPTVEVLSPQMLVRLDGILRDELVAQRALLEGAEATVGELTGSNGGDSTHARDIAERAINHAFGIIAEIEHALERLSKATYGTCETCGTGIRAARLEAIPYTRTCVHCPPPPPLPRLD